MGGHMSKRPAEISTHTKLINSYEVASELDHSDTNLRAKTDHVIDMTSLATGVQLTGMSFDSSKDITGCLLDMDKEVVNAVLQCKKDNWKKNQALFELVVEYFENTLKILHFCVVLDKSLNSARHILTSLQQFEELKNFTEEFLQTFKSVYKQQTIMLEKFQLRKNKLNKKIKSIRVWKKVSSIIFVASFAAVLICSVVAAAMAAPPIAAALGAATSLPLMSMGKWINSLINNYESTIKGKKEVFNSMHVGTYIIIKDLDNIKVLIDRLEIKIEALLKKSDLIISEKGVKLEVEEIKQKINVFIKHIEDLGVQANMCSRDVRRARTVVLQRINKQPNH